MRLGVIADVHGNLHALDAVLGALGPVDRLICAGDLVGYGPRPDECVERLAELGALAVAGNHDLMALGRLDPGGAGPLVRLSTEWTAAAISSATRDHLAGLPPVARAEDVVVAHGSLDDPSEYVRDCDRAGAELARLDKDALGLVLGHTHHPLQCGGEPWLLNPGSVGQSRERRPLARGAVIDTGSGRTRLVAADYDVRATRRELRAAGLPPHLCHLAPGRAARLRRRLAAA
jgi:predicted phosphodiesterase